MEKLINIKEVAKKLGLQESDLQLYGDMKAKINKKVEKEDGNLILVTATNPNAAGSGKTTTSIGLLDAMWALDKKAVACLREPSLGPIFGIKGGATGGGKAQAGPSVDINLHFTGDLHAITSANYLIAAVVDNHIFQGNDLDITKIIFKRCLDMNDRTLRHLNNKEEEVEFVITAASEIMATLTLAKDLEDLKNKIANIVIGYNSKQEKIQVSDLKIEGAVTALLTEAIKPNLVQSFENNPVLIHGGPFANIAHGCSSLIGTKLGLNIADYVITEAGFGADLGSEKFIDIKTRIGKLNPKAVVLVVNLRAIKLNVGLDKSKLNEKNQEALEKGIENLEQHLNIIKNYNLGYVVALNKFPNEDQEELEYLTKWCQENNHTVVVSDVFNNGSQGGIDLAKEVISICDKQEEKVKFIYEDNDTFEEKVNKVVTKVYGGKGFKLTQEASEDLELLRKNKMGHLPICIAKTHSSLSDDPTKLGKPTNFEITISELKVNAGGGFIVVITSKVMTMPGLPKKPLAETIDVDNNEKIIGVE